MSPEDARFQTNLGETLRQRGHELTYIPQNKPTNKELVSQTDQSYVSSDILNHEPNNSLSKIVKNIDAGSPRSLIFPQMVYDRNYVNSSYEKFDISRRIIRYLQGYTDSCYCGEQKIWKTIFSSEIDDEPYLNYLHKSLSYLNEFFDHSKKGVILQCQGAEVLRLALTVISNKYDIDSIWVGWSPLTKYSGFYTNKYFDIGRVVKSDWDQLDPERKQKVHKIISEVTDNTKIIGGTGPSWSDILKGTVNAATDFDIPHPLSASIQIAKTFRSAINKRKYESIEYSREYIKSNKYIYYPLQIPRESRVTVRAPEFYNQGWLIEYLYRSLPEGIDLVTKDHPHHLDFQTGQIRNIMNRFTTAVHPDLNSRRIIKHSCGIVTLNNTVGFEALVHRKPVLTLGNSTYSSDLTINNTNTKNIPIYLQDLVDSTGPTEKEVKMIVNRMIDISYPVKWNDNSPKNINNLVDSIESFALRRFKKGC